VRGADTRSGALLRLGASAALLVGTARAAGEGVSDGEEALFRRAHGLSAGFEPVLWAPMQLGSALAPLVVGPLLGHHVGDWRPAVGSVAVGIGGWWAAKGVKALVRRGRPASLLGDVAPRRGTPSDGSGFLSGHVTVATGLATVAAPHLGPVGRPLAYGLVGVVGFARLHVAAHLPLDVVGGVALGGLLGSAWDLLAGPGRAAGGVVAPSG
jgi:membrane-associated phospholipid phosphatase